MNRGGKLPGTLIAAVWRIPYSPRRTRRQFVRCL